MAQQAYTIFEQSCLNCHGPNGAFTEEIIIQHTALIETGAVVPGKPIESELYRRLLDQDPAKRMPLGQPQLPAAAILTIGNWIQAGAPDWQMSERDADFITSMEMLETIEKHVKSLAPFDRAFTRYFTMMHLYNAGESTETLHAYQRALSKLVNSLSWGREVIKPKPIDPEETIFYIDLRDYEWEIGTNRWTLIEQMYPYRIEFDAPAQTRLREKLTDLREDMNCEVPFVHVDWFIATASLPPLYHDILDLPETDRELEARLEVNVVENIRNAPGRRVWRAGFNDSGVSNHNRIVERHTSRYGAYWKSYDFAGSVGKQNIFVHPMSFNHDGGEVVFNLPNGLQAYYLSDARGNRLDEAPTQIVSNPAASDPTVRNGISCIDCHTEGIKTFEDEVRNAIEGTPDTLYDKAHALRLYVEKEVMDRLVEFDKQRYETSLIAATAENVSEIEPISRFYERFNGTLDAAHAATALGLRTENFLRKIQETPDLQRLGLGVLETGEIKRDIWTANFNAILSAVNAPKLVEAIVEETEIVPIPTEITRAPDDVVYIPDPNLRKVLSKIFVKSKDQPITIQEMQGLEELGDSLNGQGIKDLTGLEYAINLTALNFEENQVSDLSPLAGLTKLRFLVAKLNPISDLSSLAGLTELEHIVIHARGITDISVFAGKENLRQVLIWHAPFKDMSLFANLPNIERLDLCGAGISEIPSLENAPNLKDLYLLDNDISDVSVLKNLTGLERLSLKQNNITDVSPLANLTNLKWLSIESNPIADYSVLDELSKNTKIEPAGFAFIANTERVGIGNIFTFDINALFIRNLVGWQCNISFDAELLEVVEVIEGDFLSQDGSATLFGEGTIDTETGIISGYNVLRLDGKGVSGSGTLLSVKFRAKEVGTAVFRPGNCFLGDSEGEEIPSIPSIPSEAPRLEIEIVADAAQIEDPDDVFTSLKKDVNRDGIVNILDMILVSKNIGKPINEAPHTDVNGDGVINILDLVYIADAFSN